MAAVLKHWKESASLIIASKRLAVKQPKQTLMNKLLRKAPPRNEKTLEEQLRFLMLKRSSGNTFMPNVYVFPGGMVDNTDFAKGWLEVLGGSSGLLDKFNKATPGSPIFSRQREPEFSYIASDVALRLAAIRETFEESGILLARPKSDLEEKSLFSNTHPSFATVCSIPEAVATEWRRQIKTDPAQLLVMCRELGTVPDIWSLYEWSNWLTPPLKGKRFDTAFFISCVDEAPDISLSDESTHGVWSHPADLLKECSEGSVAIAPPQTYELSRLVRFGSVDSLLSFAWKRSKHRVERWMPVIYSCCNGTIFALPGDDLYPENPDLTGEIIQVPIQRTETTEDLLRLYPRHHRAVIDKNRQISLYCNIEFIDGHVLPCEYNRQSAFRPKL